MPKPVCRAKDPSACRYHGAPLESQYKTMQDEYNKTGVLPKVLFASTTVNPTIDTAKLVEYESYPDLNLQSYGFPPYVGEDTDLTAYVETPMYENADEEKNAIRNMQEESTDPITKARYGAILEALSQDDADNKLLTLQTDSRKHFNDLIRSSDYETSVADSHIIHQYGKEADALEGLNDAEKAIVLWESLKKNQGHGMIDLGEYGTKSYEKVATDSWNVYTFMQERK